MEALRQGAEASIETIGDDEELETDELWPGLSIARGPVLSFFRAAQSAFVDVNAGNLPSKMDGSLASLMAAALERLAEGHFVAALSVLTLEFVPDQARPSLLSLRAVALDGLGQYLEAEAVHSDALSVGPGTVFGHWSAASHYHVIHRQQPALAHIDKALAACRELQKQAEQRSGLPPEIGKSVWLTSSIDMFCRPEAVMQELSFIRRKLGGGRLNTDAALPAPVSETAALNTVRAIGGSASRDYGKAISSLRAILAQHPSLPAAQMQLAKLLLRTRPEDPVAMTECLQLLRSVMVAEPKNLEAIVDFITLLQQVQMARFQLGTHPEGSLSAQILAAGLRGLSHNSNHVEILRIISVQYRYKKEWSVARKYIVRALLQLLVGFQNLANSLLCPPGTDYTASSLELVTVNQLRFSAATLLSVLGISEEVLRVLSADQLTNLKRWVSFCRSDLGFVNICEAQHMLELAEDPDALRKDDVWLGLLRLAEEDFTVAYDLFPNSSTLFGMSELHGLKRNSERQYELLNASYRMQPTFIVQRKLQEMESARQRHPL